MSTRRGPRAEADVAGERAPRRSGARGAAPQRPRRADGAGAAAARRRGEAPARVKPVRAKASRTDAARDNRGKPGRPRTTPNPAPTRAKSSGQAKARAKARKAKAPKLVRIPLRIRLANRLSEIDLRPHALAAKVPFVVLVIGALGVGLAVTLWLSTDAAERAYQLGNARQVNQALQQQKDALVGFDFECRPRGGAFIGAYEGPADAGSWVLAAALKPDLCGDVPGMDAGMRDAGTLVDAAGRDAPGSDGGTTTTSSGCGCRAGRRSVPWTLVLALAALAITRRRSGSRRSTRAAR